LETQGKSRNLITDKPELKDKSENLRKPGNSSANLETLGQFRKRKCKSGNWRANQEAQVQIWKLEGKSGNGSANLETLGQFRKLKVKSRNLSVNLEI